MNRATLDAQSDARDPTSMTKKKASAKKAAPKGRDEDFATVAFGVVEQATGERLAPKKKG